MKSSRNTPTSRNFLHSLRPSSAKNAGFTLIEIMIVVTIIGIVAALAVASMRGTINTTQLDSVYRKSQKAFHRCRAEGINAASASTDPTMPAMVLFANGYACIQWADTDSNFKLGSGSKIDFGMNGRADAGEADDEIRTVYFQERFDSRYELNSDDAAREIYLDEVDSVLNPAGHDQTGVDTGYAFVVAPGGYYQTPLRTTMVARIELKQPTSLEPRFNDPNFHPNRYCVFPSGQTLDPLRVPGAC